MIPYRFEIKKLIVGVALALLGAFVVCASWTSLPLPGSRWIHSLCLPFDWQCRADEQQAMISTANATWWVLVATAAGALATFSAVFVALDLDQKKSAAEDLEKTLINQSAKTAVIRAYEVVKNSLDKESINSSDLETLGWNLIGRVEAHRRTIEHYLSMRVTNDEIVLHCNSAIQRLYEAKTSFGHIAKNVPYLDGALQNISIVIARIKSDESDLEKLQVVVLNGVLLSMP